MNRKFDGLIITGAPGVNGRDVDYWDELVASGMVKDPCDSFHVGSPGRFYHHLFKIA